MTTEERIDQLEKKLKRCNRWMLAVGLLAVALCVALMLPGAKAINAKEISLCDENGKTRGLLFVENCGPKLTLFDENGKTRGVLCVNKDASRLCLYDANEKTRASLAVSSPVFGRQKIGLASGETSCTTAGAI